MRIRDRRLIAAAGWVGTRLVHALAATLRFKTHSFGPVPLDPASASSSSRFIYVLWHENFLVPISRLGHPSVSALVSQHADGQILGSLLRSSRMGIVRGSTSRGAVTAVRQVLRNDSRFQHLAVTPDGPRGPRRQVQPGVVYLAAKTGMQLVPLAVGHHNPYRVNSWDSFVVPRPFSRLRCIFGSPIDVPGDCGEPGLTHYRTYLQEELTRLTRVAQDWADSDVLKLPPIVTHARMTLPAIQQTERAERLVSGVVSDSGD
jgi:lysophospholipid acyltransferase (LPLAT)-like uncharacterized protein